MDVRDVAFALDRLSVPHVSRDFDDLLNALAGIELPRRTPSLKVLAGTGGSAVARLQRRRHIQNLACKFKSPRGLSHTVR